MIGRWNTNRWVAMQRCTAVALVVVATMVALMITLSRAEPAPGGGAHTNVSPAAHLVWGD